MKPYLDNLLKRINNIPITVKVFLAYFFIFTMIDLGTGLFAYHITFSYIRNQENELSKIELKQTKKNILYKLDYYKFLLNSFLIDIEKLSDTYINSADIRSVMEARNKISSSSNKIISYDNGVSGLEIYTDNPNIAATKLNIHSYNDFMMNRWIIETEENVFTVKDDYFDPNQNKYVLSFFKRSNTDTYHTIVSIDIFLDKLFYMYNYDERGRTFLVFDKNDRLMYANRSELLDKEEPIFGLNTLKPRFYTKDSIVIHEHLENYGWHIYSVTSLYNVMLSTKYIYIYTILICLVSTLISIGITSLIARRFSNRIRQLIIYLEHIGNGDFEYNAVTGGTDEISEISGNIALMGTRIKTLLDGINSSARQMNEMQVRFIYAQFNTHYLYNTLSTMNWLCIKNNDEETSDIIVNLSEFYRGSLNKGNEIIDVNHELYVIRCYINIMKCNFKDLFDINYEIDSELGEYKMIKLLILPLVENALIHGIFEKQTHGTVIVKCSKCDCNVNIEVIDDGVGISSQALSKLYDNPSKNIVITNERLKLYYGDQYGVSIFSRPGCGTVSKIILPICDVF